MDDLPGLFYEYFLPEKYFLCNHSLFLTVSDHYKCYLH